MRDPQQRAADVERLRGFARNLLLEHGTSIAPGTETPEAVNDMIGDLAKRHEPELHAHLHTLFDAISDRMLCGMVDGMSSRIMAAYGDAGYWVGLAVGLELAALVKREVTQ